MKKKLYNLIPLPAEILFGNGEFVISNQCRITLPANLKIAGAAALQLQNILLRHTKLNLAVSEQISNFPAIIFTLDEQLPPEGYSLDITQKNVIIAASDNAGFLYAVATLRQLLPLEAAFGTSDATAIPLPCLSINDAPRFPWRGMMLDVSRHDFSLEYLKQHMELMYSLKLNRLHLHLTDSQSWRLEIKAYPELTEQGGHTSHSGRYAEFYTQKQMKELIDYAANLNIEIIPEIDIPGHSKTAVNVLDLGCTPHSNVLCAGKLATFEFIDRVFAEVAALFPAPYVHVGGDECSKDNWKKCPACQTYMHEHGIKDEDALQSHIIQYAEKLLARHGKRLIGWDEILEGGLAPDATVMSWRGTAGGIAAANSGHDVIMSPTTHCYLDYYQSRLPEPKAIGAYLTLKTAYEFDPTQGMDEAAKSHVLGVQGNLWTEFIPDERQASYMINPRLEAIAEVAWSPSGQRNWRDFARRIMAFFNRFELEGRYYRGPRVEMKLYGKRVKLTAELPGCDILYTTDGSEPDLNCPRLHGNQTIEVKGDEIIKARVVGTAGKLYPVTQFDTACQAITNMPCFGSSYLPENVFNNNLESYFWNGAFPKKGEYFKIIYFHPRDVRQIILDCGVKDDGQDWSYFKNAVLEISGDGRRFHKIATLNTPKLNLKGDWKNVKAVRARILKTQESDWLRINLFHIL